MSINNVGPAGMRPGKGKRGLLMKKLQAKGIGKQEMKEYLKSQGYNSRQEVMQARRNGERPLAGLLQQLGITPPKLDQQT